MKPAIAGTIRSCASECASERVPPARVSSTRGGSSLVHGERQPPRDDEATEQLRRGAKVAEAGFHRTGDDEHEGDVDRPP